MSLSQIDSSGIKRGDRVVFTGSIVALVTPMQLDGTIDFAALASLIEWHILAGTSGLVIMGTTGEASLVSEDEHIATVKFALEVANKRTVIIAGCGQASTAKTLRLIEQLNGANPDGYLCVTPYYVKPTQLGLINHFTAVAQVATAPVLLYNVPSRTGCDLVNGSVIELADNKNIVGLKDATGDLSRIVALRQQVAADFYLLSGDDASAFEFVRLGGDGVISVTGNIAPTLMNHWCTLLLADRKRNQQKAELVFEQLNRLHQVLFIESNPIPVKWALAQMKKINESIRLPLTNPQPESQSKITQALIDSAIAR